MAQQYGFPAEEKVGTATDGVIEGACENVSLYGEPSKDQIRCLSDVPIIFRQAHTAVCV